MTKKNILITLMLSLAIAIPAVSVVSAANAKTTVTDATYQEPVKTLEESTDETLIDSSFLKQHNMSLKKPNTVAILSEEDAIKAASEYFQIAASAKSIKVEYHLLTSPSINSFSESALNKNEKLKKEGLNGTPVYIVTFKGVEFPSAGGSIRGGKIQHVTFTENNVVVDANSGEVLFSFSYK